MRNKLKTMLSIILAFALVFTSIPVSAFAATDATATVPEENYMINPNKYMTRLHTNIDNEAEFELGFKVHWDGEEEDRYTAAMGENLLANGKIQIDDGKLWSFKDAEMSFATEKSKSSFKTTNKEFIKGFYNKDTFKITVVTPEEYTVVAENIHNDMDETERAAFEASIDKKPVTSEYTVDPVYTFLRDQYGSRVFRIDIKEFTSGSDPAKKAFLESATIKINGIDFGSMKSLGFTITNYFGFELADLSKIKSVIMDDQLKVVLTNNGKDTVFEVKNELSKEARQEIAGTEAEKDLNNIGTAKVMLVKSDDTSQESMSGTTMKHEAEMITDKDGNITMVLHFEPAVIMGILAYATDLKLTDYPTEFVLKDDNSAVCFVKLPSFDEVEKIYQGHIYSSVMDADVALKIHKPEKIQPLNEALNNKVASVEKMLKDKNFYEETKKPVVKAIEDAETAVDKVAAYIDIERAVAGLREVATDPFTGDTVFHVEAIDTSVIGSKSLEKYVKVEIKNGKKILTAHYSDYLDWDGHIYCENIKVLDEGGKEIPSDYILDDDKNGTLTFEMPYVPASGIFDLKLTIAGKGEIASEMQMDYGTIVKGPFKKLLEDAIEKYGKYTDNDWNTRVDMENRKDDYTESTWNVFENALNICKDDLNLDVITQDKIEKDVKSLKDARNNLLYKIKAGKGNTANIGISGLNNPSVPYYPSDANAEYPEVVGWAGSKVVFGNDGEVFRVLNTGISEDGKTNTGKILLMSEKLRVKKPFTDDANNTTVRWKDSIIREYMNSDIYNNEFSDVEKSAIVKSKITTSEYTDGYLGPPTKLPNTGVETEDYIFAPGMDMLTNESYGFGSNDSRVVAKEYAFREVMEDVLGDMAVLGVSSKGRIGGQYVLNSKNLEAPVCMNIDSKDILMSIDAKAGIPDRMTSVKAVDSNTWKFIMHDESMKLNKEYKAKVEGNKVSLDLGKTKDKVMAIVVEGNSFATGKVKSYGFVNPESFEVPGFDKSKEKLYVMTVRDNAGKTAYASEPALVTVNENIKPDVPSANRTTATVKINQDNKETVSMCNPMFAEKADIELNADKATVKLYVAYPVPAFTDLGKDGTIKDFIVKYNGVSYKAASDITSKPIMTVKESNSLFGLVEGDKITAQVITVDLPVEALKEKHLDVSCYVNVVMNTNVDFDMVLSDIKIPDEKPAVKEVIKDVTFSKYFPRVNDTTYKYRSRGKHVNANPVVKDADGNVLVKDTDYTVVYSDENRVLPGKYTVTVKGMGDYTGTVEKTLVITPKAVDGVNVRQSTATGGYDDAYLTWAESEGADGYQVYKRISGRDWDYVGRTTKTSFLEKDLYDGHKYEFKVIPYVYVDGTRFRSTDRYDEVSMYTMKKVSTPSVKKYSSSRVRISWNNISGESGYQVMASRSGKTTYFRTSNTSIKLSVAKNKKYTYKVRAYKNVTKNGKTYRVYAPWSSARTYTLR